MTRVCVGILAGGRSSRMGRDKAGVMVAGKTLGERAVTLARSVTDDVVALGHARGMPPVAALADTVEDAGPVEGIRNLLASRDADAYVIIPVDMPFLDAADLRALLEVGTNARFDASPLPCVIRSGATLARDGSVHAALASIGAVAIPCADPGRLENLNGIEDVDRASRRLAFR